MPLTGYSSCGFIIPKAVQRKIVAPNPKPPDMTPLTNPLLLGKYLVENNYEFEEIAAWDANEALQITSLEGYHVY